MFYPLNYEDAARRIITKARVKSRLATYYSSLDRHLLKNCQVIGLNIRRSIAVCRHHDGIVLIYSFDFHTSCRRIANNSLVSLLIVKICFLLDVEAIAHLDAVAFSKIDMVLVTFNADDPGCGLGTLQFYLQILRRAIQ